MTETQIADIERRIEDLQKRLTILEEEFLKPAKLRKEYYAKMKALDEEYDKVLRAREE
jgi:hypothetical protein